MRPILLITIPLLLSACVGGGSGSSESNQPLSEIEVLRNEAARLSEAVSELDPTSPMDVPTSGNITYTGLATLGFFTESSGGDGVGGDMSVEVDFADNEVTGQISNFYSRDGDAREGQLNLSDGQLLRISDGVILAANVSGTLEIIGGAKDLDGSLAGAFVGEDADYVAGAIEVSYPLELAGGGGTVDVDLDGGFIVEKQE
jgi:hypothetical protein